MKPVLSKRLRDLRQSDLPGLALDEPAFTAWHRPTGGRWQAVGRADTLTACEAVLLAALPRLPAGDSMVLPGGERPGKRRWRWGWRRRPGRHSVILNAKRWQPLAFGRGYMSQDNITERATNMTHPALAGLKAKMRRVERRREVVSVGVKAEPNDSEITQLSRLVDSLSAALTGRGVDGKERKRVVSKVKRVHATLQTELDRILKLTARALKERKPSDAY